MIVEVDVSSPVPPYEQVRAQIAGMAATGALPVGTRLPSIRQLARDLGLAGGTVARAYRELEAAGVVVSRVRHGTTVAPPRPASGAEAVERLDEAAVAFVAGVRALGHAPDEVLRAVERALGR